MKNLYKLGCSLVFLLMTMGAIAQQRVVTGKVTDASGVGIPGVNLVIKGTSNGTATDATGSYSIQVPGDQSVIVFSFIGFTTQEIQVGSRASIDVSLEASAETLSEVVVTALGIERDTRTLGYALTTVDGGNFTKARETNVANSLVGRIAGVNVSTVNGGPGSSSNVNIRGMNSLSPNGSPPLYVINGVPMDNSTRGSAGQWGGADLGDGIANINPDDIEDITVLKGATASALYGSRASSGVIIITTKKGKKGGQGLGIEINSNYTADKVRNLTDFQYVYGQGVQNSRPIDQNSAYNSGLSSWGDVMDGAPTYQFDGVQRPYSPQKKNIENFYRTGHTFTNTVSLTGSGENMGYRFSAANMTNESVVPNSGMNRNTFNLNLNSNLTQKLKFDLVTNFVSEKSNNRPNLSDSPGNSNYGITFLPTSLDEAVLRPGDKDGIEIGTSNNVFVNNPWFAANKFVNDAGRKRIINIVKLQYNLTSWLSLQGRIGNDYSSDRYTTVTPYGTAYRPTGDMSETSSHTSETNADFLLTASKDLTTDISFSASVGGNLRKLNFESITGNGTVFSIPFLYVLDNLVNKNTTYGKRQVETQSFYYTAEFSYKNMLFLNTTGRSDKFSALDGRSIFYPSAGMSFVFSELVDAPVLSFGKVRSSWARSTGDPTQYAYQTSLYYSIDQSNNGKPIGVIKNGSIPNNDLKPYTLAEIELGVELKFLNNRLGLDAAYYNRKTKDEIVGVTTSPTSGYSSATLNVGSLENKGFELLLTGSPVKTQDFSWNISFNFTHNTNKVTKLAEGLDQITVGTSRTLNAFVNHVVGKPAAQVMAFDYSRNASGQIMYDAAGWPIQGKLIPMGSGMNNQFGGLNNELNYKNFNLSFLIDFKMGGKLFSATNYYAYVNGLHQNTLVNREEGIVGAGVGPDGSTPNNVTANSWDYYPAIANRISSQFVYDASFVKLRQLVFGFNLPREWFGKTAIKAASLSLVGRNLAILKKHTPNVDPESNYNNSAAQGLELAGVPSTRSLGFNLNIKF